jgi:hypothetical protein
LRGLKRGGCYFLSTKELSPLQTQIIEKYKMKRKENSLIMNSKVSNHSKQVSRMDFNKLWDEINAKDNLADIPEFRKVGNLYEINWIEFK